MRCDRSPPAAHDRRPLVVEFLGTPGVGKTTLSRELISLLADRGVVAANVVGAARGAASRSRVGSVVDRLGPARGRRAALWQLFCLLGVTQCVRFAHDNPKLARFVFTTQVRRPLPITTRVQVLRWFVQLAGRYRLLTRTSGELDVLVLDDGFLHRAVHLHADHVSEPDLACLAAYIDLVPRPDLVIFTTARADTCERRVRARGVWRHSRHLSRAELSRYMANAERVATQAAHLASERGWQVIEIENEQRTLDDARHDLAGALELLTLDQLAMRDCLSGVRA